MKSTIWWFLAAIVVAVAGAKAGLILGLEDISQSPGYEYLTYALLSIGLYGSVSSIDPTLLRESKALVFRAATLGVVFKIAVISVVFYGMSGNPLAPLLAVTVAQIDPLSVAQLMQAGSSKLSPKGRTILAAWSSFDDPMTVLIAIYVAGIVTASHPTPLDGYVSGEGVRYLADLAVNLAIATGAYVIRDRTKASSVRNILLLAIVYLISVLARLPLAIAIVGLFLRPIPVRALPPIVNLASLTSFFLLGILSLGGISVAQGAALAVAAICAQVVAGLILTGGLDSKDRYRLALSQQNGITAVILALLYEPTHPGMVSIVAPAIIGINFMYIVLNSLFDWHHAKKSAAHQ